MMVAIAVLALCLAAIRAMPGMGVPLALLLVPATLRASLHIEARRSDGRPMNWSEKNDTIAASVMLAVLLLPAAGIAFAATCVPIGCANGADEFGMVEGRPGLPPGLIVAIIAGLVMGILVSYALGRKFWPRRD